MITMRYGARKKVKKDGFLSIRVNWRSVGKEKGNFGRNCRLIFSQRDKEDRIESIITN